MYSQIPKNASLLGIFPDFSENFQKSSKIINLNIREQFQKDDFTSGTDRLKSRLKNKMQAPKEKRNEQMSLAHRMTV